MAFTLHNSECSCILTNIINVLSVHVRMVICLSVCCRCTTSKGRVFKILPLSLRVRLQVALMYWITRQRSLDSVIAQQSMDMEPLGSGAVNVAAPEFRVECQDTLNKKG